MGPGQRVLIDRKRLLVARVRLFAGADRCRRAAPVLQAAKPIDAAAAPQHARKYNFCAARELAERRRPPGFSTETERSRSFLCNRAVQAGIFICALALPCASTAATIYGFVQEHGEPVKKKKITLECKGENGKKIVVEAFTDIRGNFRLAAAHIGRCDLSVGTAKGGVVLFPQPVQYHLEIRDGKLIRR